MMKFKKLFSCVLACTMLLTMPLSAKASEAPAQNDPEINTMIPEKSMLENVQSLLPQTFAADDRIADDEFLVALEELYVLNKLRAAYQLEPLAFTDKLLAAASQRANECIQLFSHKRPNGQDCFSILPEYSIYYTSAGENIAKGQMNVEHVMTSWFESQGHRDNMLNSTFQAVGLGYRAQGPSWTQVFVGGYTVTNMKVQTQAFYQPGLTIEEQGLILYPEYNTGDTGILPVINEMVSNFDPNKRGKQTITISYLGNHYDVDIYVENMVEKFVSRLYTEVLGRQPDPAGLKAWTDVLTSQKEQGAQVAKGFIESIEFKNRGLSDQEYIKVLYRTFLNREADPAGLAAWQKVLDEGLSRMHVFKGFAESQEFTDICASYNIIRGNVVLTAPMDQNEGVTKFIARCYKLCLGRKGDEAGINGWCNQILTGKNTAKEAAYGFIFSAEFINKKLSDSDYVKTLYKVFMDREADPQGLNSWIKVLENGNSREHVFNGFADSVEFKKICASYGIK